MRQVLHGSATTTEAVRRADPSGASCDRRSLPGCSISLHWARALTPREAGAIAGGDYCLRLRTELPPARMPLIIAATASCISDSPLSTDAASWAAAASLRMPTTSNSARIFMSPRQRRSDSQIAKAASPETSWWEGIVGFPLTCRSSKHFSKSLLIVWPYSHIQRKIS
jgi:hypothetical protein